MSTIQAPPRPYGLVAELTYRCPLQCPYCSNPLDYGRTFSGELSAGEWGEVFRQAADLGVLQVGLTGGEPGVRPDLPAITKAAAETGLYSNLVTAGTVFTREKLARLRDAGLRAVQLSLQDAEGESNDRLAGVPCFDKKMDFASWVRELSLPLTVNVVLHRLNLGHIDQIISMAVELGAHRLELANTQYYAWALTNRSALMPTGEQLEYARRAAKQAQQDFPAMEVLFVLPDYFGGNPKPCSGGWGRQLMVIDPEGQVLPCHVARVIPDLTFESVRNRSLKSIWLKSDGFTRFRGTGWMPEPCRSCDRKEVDFGGCRCQAYLLTGDAVNTDPACQKSPHHDLVADARQNAAQDAEITDLNLNYRRLPPREEPGSPTMDPA